MTYFFYCDIIFVMKRKSIFICLFLCLSFVCFGQSADFISKMIEAEDVSYEDVAYLCAINLELISEEDSGAEALAALDKAKVFSMPKNPSDSVSYGVVANMFMKTWKIKGGLMYSITKANRYAFRELQYLGFIAVTENPSSKITGLEMLNLLTKCMEYVGE